MNGTIKFVVYRLDSGRIVATGSAQPEALKYYPGAGEAVLRKAEADPATQYVDVAAQTVVPRPTLAGFDRTSLAVGSDEVATLTVGAPFVATINGEAVEVADGTLELDAGYPGTYRVVVEAWPRQKYEETITCA